MFQFISLDFHRHGTYELNIQWHLFWSMKSILFVIFISSLRYFFALNFLRGNGFVFTAIVTLLRCCTSTAALKIQSKMEISLNKFSKSCSFFIYLTCKMNCFLYILVALSSLSIKSPVDGNMQKWHTLIRVWRMVNIIDNCKQNIWKFRISQNVLSNPVFKLIRNWMITELAMLTLLIYYYKKENYLFDFFIYLRFTFYKL